MVATPPSSALGDIAARRTSEPSAARSDMTDPASSKELATISIELRDPLDYLGAIRDAVEGCLKAEELEKYYRTTPRQRVEFPVSSSSGNNCCHNDGLVTALREENGLLEKRVAFLEHALKNSQRSRILVS